MELGYSDTGATPTPTPTPTAAPERQIPSDSQYELSGPLGFSNVVEFAKRYGVSPMTYASRQEAEQREPRGLPSTDYSGYGTYGEEGPYDTSYEQPKTKWQEYLDWRKGLNERIEKAIADERASSVDIGVSGDRSAIPGQALRLGKDADYVPTASSVPGGSFSATEVSNLGPDQTPEAQAAWLKDWESGETRRKINIIEQSAPAKYRGEATSNYLQTLYDRAATEEEGAARNRLADAQMIEAQARTKEAEATGQYYTGLNEAKTAGDLLDFEAAVLANTSAEKKAVYANYQKWMDVLAEDAAKGNAEAGQKFNAIIAAIETAPSSLEAYKAVALILSGANPTDVAGATPAITGIPELDRDLAPRPGR
jgi:hypothetical protein